MTMGSDFRHTSYRRHAGHYRPYAQDAPLAARAARWLRPRTADAWYHARLHANLDPLLSACPGAHWLTVGDGRFGGDARYIASRGGRPLATDIAGTLLAEAHRRGLIPAWSRQNAEALSFPDASFDLVCCKESFHHFPRPMAALYEMLRVARRAVVLIEPSDRRAAATLLQLAAIRAARRLRGEDAGGHWEPSGNYVYTLSLHEVRKAALALDLPALAVRRFNSCHLPGIEEAPARDRDPRFARLKRRLRLYDGLTRLGLMAPNSLSLVLFRTPPAAVARRALARGGYRLEDLPRNPRRRP